MSSVNETVNGSVRKLAGGLTLPAFGTNQPKPVQTMDGNASSPATASDGAPSKITTAQENNGQATATAAKENKTPIATGQQKTTQQASTTNYQQDATGQATQDTHNGHQGVAATAIPQFNYPAQFPVNGQTYNFQEMLQDQQKLHTAPTTAQVANDQADIADDFASPFTNEYIARRSAAGFIPNNAPEMNQAIDHPALLGAGSDLNFEDMDFGDMSFDTDDSDKFFAEMNQSLVDQAQHGQGDLSGQHQQDSFLGNLFPYQQFDNQGNAIGSPYPVQQFDMTPVPAMHQQQYGHQGTAFVQQPQMHQGNMLHNHSMQTQLNEQGNIVGITSSPQPGQQANMMLPNMGQQQQQRPDTLPPAPVQPVPNQAPVQQPPRSDGRLKAVRSKPRAQNQRTTKPTAQRQRSRKQTSQGTMQQALQRPMANSSTSTQQTQAPMNMAQHHNSQTLPSQSYLASTHNMQMLQPLTGVPAMDQRLMQPAPPGLMLQQQIMHTAGANPQMTHPASTKPKGQKLSEEDLINRTNAMTGHQLGNTASAMASSGN
jgi:hypothetical protein